MNQHDPEEFLKEKRLLMVYFGIALIIQVIVLISYYFNEKQTALAFPMILGIFITAGGLFTLYRLGK
ncbi:hypothetical protein ACF3NG_03565 [Aerococcaceae bacterium WGS1372]